MDKKSGKKIFNGIAIGKIRFYSKAENKVSRTKVEDVDAEGDIKAGQDILSVQ